MKRGTFGHPSIHTDGRRIVAHCDTCDHTDSIASGLTPEANRKKFEAKGWSFTHKTATCPNHQKEKPMKNDTAPHLIDDRPGAAFEKLMPKQPQPTKSLVSSLLEAASLLDGARLSLSDYSNQELMEELQRRMK